MNRTIKVYALFIATAAALGAQQGSQSNPYEGTSAPPTDDVIVSADAPVAKPPAGHLATPAQPVAPQPQATEGGPVVNYPTPSSDDGLVQAEQRPASAWQGAPAQPILTERAYAADPDGDIVHPRALGPGELAEGTTIRVRLLQRLSTASTEKGETFSSRVASDVLQGGQVLIPAGAEIDGRVVEVSSGHMGGHGEMRLRPETVVMGDGSRYRLNAEVTGTPGSRTRVGGEGTISPDSRIKRDSVEYGGAVGAGAVTGAIVAGPVGALTGSLIGAGVITVHLLSNHPQAILEPGTALLFTLTEPLNLVPAGVNGN
jgi:hypothetical protein